MNWLRRIMKIGEVAVLLAHGRGAGELFHFRYRGQGLQALVSPEQPFCNTPGLFRPQYCDNLHEMPLKKDLGTYEILETRIRVIDLDTNTVANVFPAPRQVMSLASSQDGKKLYAFSVGKDISVLNPETGQIEDIIPMADWNLTGGGKL